MDYYVEIQNASELQGLFDVFEAYGIYPRSGGTVRRAVEFAFPTNISVRAKDHFWCFGREGIECESPVELAAKIIEIVNEPIERSKMTKLKTPCIINFHTAEEVWHALSFLDAYGLPWGGGPPALHPNGNTLSTLLSRPEDFRLIISMSFDAMGDVIYYGEKCNPNRYKNIYEAADLLFEDVVINEEIRDFDVLFL